MRFPWRLQAVQATYLGPITIGSEAWIAARAVLAPCTVIGPGAVVSGGVPPGAIVRGNPAVVVGQR